MISGFNYQPYITTSLIVFDGENVCMFTQKISVDFFHILYRSHARASAQRGPKRIHLLCVADRVNFHAPIEQISYVPVHTKARGCPLNEKAEANALHSSGHEKPFGQRFHNNTLHS
jgi:hypothetical protein